MFAQVKMSGALGDVSGIMQKVNGLMNIAEIQKTAASLQTNMAKMGVVTEMVEDAMDDIGDAEEIEDEGVDALIDSIADKHANKQTGGTKLVAEEEAPQKDNFDDLLADLKL